MRYNRLNIIIILLFFQLPVNAEEFHWQSFYDNVYPESSIDNGSYIMMCCYNCFVKLDKKTGQMDFFDNSNTVIRGNDFYNKTFIKDNDGNLYYATYTTIYKYDGNEWSIYLEPGKSYPDDKINSICVDSDNKLMIAIGNRVLMYQNQEYLGRHIFGIWDACLKILSLNDDIYICLDGGLYKYENGVFDNTYNKVGYYSNNESGEFDSQGNLWLCHKDGRVRKQNIDSSVTFDHSNSILPDADFNSLSIDNNDNVWVATDKGLFNYDGQQWIEFEKKTEIESDEIKSVFVDNENKLWFNSGNSFYSLEQNKLYKTRITNSPFPIPWEIINIVQDNNGYYWIGSRHYIIKYKNGHYVQYDSSNSPVTGKRLGELAAIDDRLYFSTDEGLYYFQDNQFFEIDIDTSIVKGPFVEKIAMDSSNNLWLCYGSGIACLEGNTWHYWKNDDYNLSHINPREISVGSDGKVYVLDEYGGVFLFNLDDMSVKRVIAMFDKCQDFQLDKNNNFWLVYLDGVYFWDLNTSSLSYHYKLLYSPIALAQTENGQIWMGTHTKGIARVDTTSSAIELMNTKNSGLSFLYLHGFFCPAGNELWCTYGSRICIYSEKEDAINYVNEENNWQHHLEVYPNPSNNYINIEFDISGISDIDMTIIDVFGNEIIKHKEIENSSNDVFRFTFDVSNLSPGIYFCTIETNNAIVSQKIIISK